MIYRSQENYNEIYLDKYKMAKLIWCHMSDLDYPKNIMATNRCVQTDDLFLRAPSACFFVYYYKIVKFSGMST